MSASSIAEKVTSLAKIAEGLGLDPSNVRFLPVSVTVEPLDISVTDLLTASATEAAGPVTESGLPRIMKLSAWIAHGGPANRNRDAFLEEDLQAVVANGLFKPPYIGMVDFNHDFTPYGAWFSARYEYDPIAGQYGILAEGAMFAWRFSEMADKILAEQVRNGSVAVSMACIAQGIERRTTADGLSETVLRKPIFLTVSLLDIPPADPHARAVGSEEEGSNEEDRVVELNTALLRHFAKDGEAFRRLVEASQIHSQEGTMDLDKVIEQITAAMGEKATELIAEIKSALADASKVPGLEAKIATLEEKIASLQAEVTAANTALEVKAVEVESANAALEAKSNELATVVAERDAAKTELDKQAAERQAAALAAVREERVALLPETFIKVLENRGAEAREKVITRLVEMSDEDFQAEVELYAAGSPRTSYSERSRVEGLLSSTTGKPSGGLAIDKFIN